LDFFNFNDSRGNILMADKLLKPFEVQKRLGISRATLYDWSYKRINLQPTKIGGSLRYLESDVDEFVKSSRVDTND